MPKISFATVRRNLNFLKDHGHLREMVVDKTSRFEDKVDAHAHLVYERRNFRSQDVVEHALLLDDEEGQQLCPKCNGVMPSLQGSTSSICLQCGYKESCCY